MSILIKGMEMPKPGRYEAVIVVLDESTAEIGISPAEDDIGYWKEYSLVPVPPHGRLIDADALEYHADNVRDPMGRTEKTVMWKKIEAAPTIIPAEEGE